MQERIRIENLQESSIDNFINVCSSKRLARAFLSICKKNRINNQGSCPNVKIELINEWEKPEEAIKRKNSWLTANAKPIHTFFMETEKFKQEIRQAMN
jgi:hypothetical protein